MYHQLLATHYETLLTDLVGLQRQWHEERSNLEAKQAQETEEDDDADEDKDVPGTYNPAEYANL